MKKISLILACLCLASAVAASSPPYSAPPGTGSDFYPPSEVPPGSGPTISPPMDGPRETQSYGSPPSDMSGTGTAPSPWRGSVPSHDWLSDDVGFLTYYGPFGYPVWGGFYDYRFFYDEWYPVARSFLDGTPYYTYYFTEYRPVYVTDGWWNDPQGYRPLYRTSSGFSFSGTTVHG